MTVFVYVNAIKVSDPEHIEVFANADAARTWFEQSDPEGVDCDMMFWIEPARRINPHHGHQA